MAKDLTYFKFFVSEWNDGDITTCSFSAQGLFANLCSVYWSREGDLSFEKARKKFPKASEKLWKELQTEHVFKIVEGKLVINFLDEQLKEMENVSNQNSNNAKLRWKRTKQDAVASVPQCDNLEGAMPIDKIREEKIRKEKKINTVANATHSLDEKKSDFYKSLLPHLEDYGKDVLREFYDYWTEASPKSKKLRFEKEKAFEIPKRLIRWKNRDLNKSPADSKPAEPYAEARHNRTLWTKEAWEEKYADKIAFDKEFQKAFGYDKL
jgi:hypothetical protein